MWPRLAHRASYAESRPRLWWKVRPTPSCHCSTFFSVLTLCSCFQKDIFNIVYLSESLHLYEVADYWRGIINMNEYQKNRFTKRIISCLFNNLTGKKIAVLGFAFKKDTSDTRETPAITLVANFVAERAVVAIYDPKVKEQEIWKELVADGGRLDNSEQHVSICTSAYEACEGADAVVVVTEWDEFSNKLPTKTPASSTSPKKTDTFQIPPKRNASLVIKSPITGDVVTFINQSAPPAPPIKSESISPPLEQKGANSHLEQQADPHPLALTEISSNLPKSPCRTNRHKHESTSPLNSRSPPARSPNRSPNRSPTDTHSHQQSIPSIEERLNAFNFGPDVAAKPDRLDWARIAKAMRKPAFVFDGRNMLDGAALEKLGFRYEAIGKASKHASLMHEAGLD